MTIVFCGSRFTTQFKLINIYHLDGNIYSCCRSLAVSFSRYFPLPLPLHFFDGREVELTFRNIVLPTVGFKVFHLIFAVDTMMVLCLHLCASSTATMLVLGRDWINAKNVARHCLCFPFCTKSDSYIDSTFSCFDRTVGTRNQFTSLNVTSTVNSNVDVLSSSHHSASSSCVLM